MKRVIATTRRDSLGALAGKHRKEGSDARINKAASTQIHASSNGFTEAEIELIESQCDEAYENYQDDYSTSELAEVVWEHVEWLQDELDPEDLSGNLFKQSVIKYAEDYIDATF